MRATPTAAGYVTAGHVTACASEGGSLRCTCIDIKQNPIKTQLDLSTCDWSGRITNKDGHLQCD